MKFVAFSALRPELLISCLPDVLTVPELHKGATATTKRTAKLVLGIFCLSCAFGALALRMAWATPPIGVVNTLLAGPVSFDEIDVVDTTPHHQVRIRAEGSSDVYAIDVHRVACGGPTTPKSI